MTSHLHFTIDAALMSENNAYKTIQVPKRAPPGTLRGRGDFISKRALTKEAKAWKAAVALQARAALGRSNLEMQPECPVTMDIVVHGNWRTKKGAPRKRDLTNLKLLVDAIFEGLGVDDSLVWELRARKDHTSAKESIEIGIWTLNTEDNDGHQTRLGL